MGQYDHIRTLPRLDGVSPWEYLSILTQVQPRGPVIPTAHEIKPSAKAPLMIQWAPHIAINRTHIFQTAEAFLKHWRDSGQTKRPTAFILGVGLAVDMDLDHLARSFDLVLFDVVESYLKLAKKEVPPLLRRRTQLKKSDITGGMHKIIIKEGYVAMRGGCPLAEFFRQSVSRTDRLRTFFSEDHKPDLVISSMLASQLLMTPLSDLLAQITEEFSESDSYSINTQATLGVLSPGPQTQLQGILLQRHLKQITDLIKMGDWAYVATDFSMSRPGNIIDPQPLLYKTDGTPYQDLSDALPPHPTMQQTNFEPWTWQVGDLRTASVQAMVLTPQLAYPLQLGALGVLR